MKYLSLTLILLTALSCSKKNMPIEAPTAAPTPAVMEEAVATDAIQWISWTEAMEANKVKPKKIFIDIYTDWCGWCKKMDKSTFIDPAVIKALNTDFYAIKFDAEQKEEIIFNDSTFKFVQQGRRGSHQLAYALLDGRMSYPSFVLLDENFHRVMLAPGFKTPDQLLPQLNYTSTNSYKTKSFDDYMKAE